MSLSGAGDGTRTRNLLITNQLLYRLSYSSLSWRTHSLRTRSLYLNGQGKVKGQMGTLKIFFHESFHATF
jgi:hypothetical protein